MRPRRLTRAGAARQGAARCESDAQSALLAPSGERAMNKRTTEPRVVTEAGRVAATRSELALGPRAAGAGPHQCRLRDARRFPPPAPLSPRPGQAGPEELQPRRAAGLRRQQHPLSHRHQDRRMGARQALPLRAARRRPGPDRVGLRLGGRASPALLRLAAAGEFPRRHARHARHRAAVGRPHEAPRRGDRRPAQGGGRRRPAGRRRPDRARHVVRAARRPASSRSTASR